MVFMNDEFGPDGTDGSHVGVHNKWAKGVFGHLKGGFACKQFYMTQIIEIGNIESGLGI